MPMSQRSMPINRRPKNKAHLIDEISFSQDRVVCKCAWAGSIPEWGIHRKLNGPRR